MISKEKKQAIIAEYGRNEGDTGSPEVQVAILTARIQELTEPEGSPLQKRPSENGRSETGHAGIFKENRYREISCFNR